MKNLKPAWKLFFTMIKQNRLIWMPLFLALLGIAMMILVGVEGDAISEEEHLLSASFTGFGYYMPFFGLFFVFVSFTNNRFFVSCPESERVITRVLPLFAAGINLILFIISLTSAVLSGHTAQMLSDVLLFNALGTAVTQLSIAFVTVQAGFAIAYFCFIPYIALIFTTENSTNEFIRNLHLYGFGVPVEISAIICAAAALISFGLSFKLSEIYYGKRTVRIMNAVAQNPLISK